MIKFGCKIVFKPIIYYICFYILHLLIIYYKCKCIKINCIKNKWLENKIRFFKIGWLILAHPAEIPYDLFQLVFLQLFFFNIFDFPYTPAHNPIQGFTISKIDIQNLVHFGNVADEKKTKQKKRKSINNTAVIRATSRLH